MSSNNGSRSKHYSERRSKESHSRSRSPIQHNKERSKYVDSSFNESKKLKKESSGHYHSDRNLYNEDEHHRPMNRQERRAHMREENFRTQKPMLVLDDPSRIPRGSYFEHDQRDTVPTEGGIFKGGRSSLRSDEIASGNDRRTSHGYEGGRRNESSSRHEARSNYYGYRNDPFENPRRRSYNEQSRSQRHRDDRRESDYRGNRHNDRRSTDHKQQRRAHSPIIWKHDKFEELEGESTS